MGRSPAASGFTLIELMITLAIMAIVITVGIPNLSSFVNAQRVRTATSDIMADIAFARAEAIKESRQAIMERMAGATGTWKDGWRICVDLNSNGTCDAAEVRKISPPISGRSKVCSTTADLDNRIVFRPDGRVVRAAAPGANDGIKVSDDNNDANVANDRIRLIFIGVIGRPRAEVQDNDPSTTRGTACP